MRKSGTYTFDKVKGQLAPVVGSFPNGRFKATLFCSGCTNKIEWTANHMPEPSAVKAKVKQKARGWNIGKREAYCKDCQGKLPRARPVDHGPMEIEPGLPAPIPVTPLVEKTVRPSIAEQIESAFKPKHEGDDMPEAAKVVTPIRAVTPPVEPNPAEAKRLRREVYSALLDAYDTENQRYHEGQSDASIAKDTGASPAFVAKLREEDFGPAGAPPELEELVADLKAAKQSLGCALQRVETAMTQATDAEKKIAAIEAKLQRVAQKHGWAL